VRPYNANDGRTAVRPYNANDGRTAMRPYNATVYRATASSSMSTPRPGLLGMGR
jgi:hypothetical protein